MTALIIYIYPDAVQYFDELCATILAQTDQDFEVIFFNDGVSTKLFQKLQFKYTVIAIEGSPLEIRFKSFEILKTVTFNQFIFIDADDTMTDNRVAVLKEKLKSVVLVTNDLNLMDDSGTIYEKKVWKDRLQEDYLFDYNFLKDKNIVGLGNTGFRKELLEFSLVFNPKPLIADWFIFYQLLKQTGHTCSFTSACQTNYRQYVNNDAGIREVTADRLSYVVKVVNHQNQALHEIHMGEFSTIDAKYNGQIINYKHKFPFWWEEISINNANI